MYISRVFIKNFRNFRDFDVAIGQGVTCFIGENNSGKTNLFHALRLVLDGNINAQRRRLQPEDLAAGLSFANAEHVLIAVEFSDFAGRPNEEALPFTAVLQNGTARISYRFRPKATVRDTLEQIPEGEPIPRLTIDDYVWEIAAGGDDVDLDAVTWSDSFGTRFSTDNLQQGYLVVFMEALRDVESRLGAPRTSPLQQIMEQRNIPDAEQARLVEHLQTANTNINASATIRTIGTQLSASFREAAGKAFAMGVSLGLGEPSFTDISRGLRVLLSGYGLTNLDPGRNGLGLNNVLYISMLLNYFEGRVAEAKTAGQLLLVEEPEAHLHPQLQRKHLSPDCSIVFVRQQRSKKGTGIEPYPKTDAGFRDVDLDPTLAHLLKNYIGSRKTGLLFETTGSLPLFPRNITRDSLHPILKKMGRTSAGFHIFRRFREAILQMSEARTLLIDYWMGHANGEMSGRYGKQLLDNIRWRQECAVKVGLGFALPENPLLDKFCEFGQVFDTKIEEAVSV